MDALVRCLNSQPKRPLLRYHGGKWLLAPWIISYFPAHRIYVEPFGGAASVLLRKPRSFSEVYNEVDAEVTNLFRVARDNGPALREALRLTPFSRAEFERSYEPAEHPIEQARRTIARSYMGFGSDGCCGQYRTGFRARRSTQRATAHDWATIPEHLDAIIDRLRGVCIESRPAQIVIPCFDTPETLFYCDPPYPHSVRGRVRGFRHEMTDAEHSALAALLKACRGMVIVSGYENELYAELFRGWRTARRRALADGARERHEVLWISPNTPETVDLFSSNVAADVRRSRQVEPVVGGKDGR